MGTVITAKKSPKKGFTLVEIAVVMLLISVLTGLIVFVMPKIIENANRTVDESDVRNLNSATAAYRTLKRLDGKSDVFEGLTSDIERMQILYDTHHISNIPVPNIKGSVFSWYIDAQKWVISGDLIPNEHLDPLAGGNIVKSSEIQMGTGGHTGFIKGSYTGGHQDIVIPNMMDGVPVTQIYQDVFKDKDLTSVVIENGITRIHARAFQGNDLTEVVLPNSIRRVDFGAFMGNDIKKVTIGAGVVLESKVFRSNDTFNEAYAAGGAGTYIFTNGNWVKQ